MDATDSNKFNFVGTTLDLNEENKTSKTQLRFYLNDFFFHGMRFYFERTNDKITLTAKEKSTMMVIHRYAALIPGIAQKLFIYNLYQYIFLFILYT